jgi:hypothetical protein
LEFKEFWEINFLTFSRLALDLPQWGKNVSLMHFIPFVNFKNIRKLFKIVKYELFHHRNLIYGINLSLGIIVGVNNTF